MLLLWWLDDLSCSVSILQNRCFSLITFSNPSSYRRTHGHRKATTQSAHYALTHVLSVRSTVPSQDPALRARWILCSQVFLSLTLDYVGDSELYVSLAFSSGNLRRFDLMCSMELQRACLEVGHHALAAALDAPSLRAPLPRSRTMSALGF